MWLLKCPTGFDLFPPVRVYGTPHLHIDPPTGVVYWVWPFLGPWSGSQLGLISKWVGWDLKLGPSQVGRTTLWPFGRGRPWRIHEIGELRASSHSVAASSTKNSIRPRGNIGSLPNSSSTSNMICFFSGVSSMGVPSHHALLLDSQSLSCKWRCSMEQLNHLSAGWDCGGLEEGDWHQHRHGGEGFWCCLDLFPPLEWVHLLLNQDHPIKVSYLSHLVNSFPWGLAEGDWVHEVEWPWEFLQLLVEALAGPVSLCRPALVMHLLSSWCSSLMHSSCCLQGSILGATTYSPSRLVLPPLGSLNQGTPKGSTQRGFQGPIQQTLIAVLGSPFSALFFTWQPHCWACAPTGTGPIPVFGEYSSPGVLFITHSKTVESGGSSQLPGLRSQSSGWIPLPTLLIWKNSHSVE